MKRTGGCMCGKVRYQATTGARFAACYCKMCQRWSAGAFMGVTCEDFAVTEGADHLTVFESSDWAQRAFCRACGSNIYYHAQGHSPSVALGSLDDTDGMDVRIQFFIDKKPVGFSLANETKALTEADCEALFAG